MKKHTKKKIILLSVIIASFIAMKAHANYYNANYDENDAEEYLSAEEVQMLEDANADDPSAERLANEREKLSQLSKDLKIKAYEEAELAQELDTAFTGNRAPAIIDNDAQIEDDTAIATDSISSQSAGFNRNIEKNRKNRSR